VVLDKEVEVYKLLAGVLLCCFLQAPVRGDEAAAVEVRVRDPHGAPLAEARVTLHAGEGRVRLAARSDAEGRYRFVALAPGEYLVAVQAAGFAGAEGRRVRLAAGEQLELQFDLNLRAVREHVLVTAARAPQTTDELSKVLDVVEADELDRRDEWSIAEGLRRIPGVRVAERGGPGGLTSIRLRGLRVEDTAVLLDGVRFRDPASTQGDASGFVSDLALTGLERVELLRGSGSSLYGTHAIGGVVNLITTEGGGRPRGGVLLEGGSLGLLRGRAHVAGGLAQDRLAYSLGASRWHARDGLDGDDEARNSSVQGRLRWRLAPATTFSARLYVADAGVQLNESPQAVGLLPAADPIPARALSQAELERYEGGGVLAPPAGVNFLPSANDPDNRRESRFLAALVRFEQRPLPGLAYSLSYHGLSTERTFHDGPAGVSFFEPSGATRSEFDGRLHTLGAHLDLHLGRSHLLSAGYEFESEHMASRSFPVEAPSSTEVTQTSHTVFVQDRLGLLDGALQLATSVRAQVFALDPPVFFPLDSSPYQGLVPAAPDAAYTADGSLAYVMRSTGTKLRVHVGTGYRAPSLFERFGSLFGVFGYSVFGDPRLSPERSLGVDAGLDQRLFGGRGRLAATYFHTRLDDVVFFDFSGAILPDSDPFGRFGGYRNVEGGSASGVELGLSARPTAGLRIELAYTYTDSEPFGGVDGVSQAFGIPTHHAAALVTAELGRSAYVSADAVFSSSYLAPLFDPATFASRVFRFAGMRRADLSAGYRLPLGGQRRLRLFAKVENVSDQTYFENGFRTPGRTVAGGAAFEF